MGPDQSVWGGVIRHMTTSNAVNSALIATIAGMLFGTLGLRFGPEGAEWAFYVILLAPLLVLLFQIILFSLVDRDRLQNDKHVEQKMMITSKIGYMKDGKPQEVEIPSSGILVQNPPYSETKE